MLKIIADENIPYITELTAPWGVTQLVAGRLITNEQLKQADVLLVRSVTKINQALLENTTVKFIGSCTAGIDHVDLDCLQKKHIEFVYAPGSNARSVAEYVLSSLLYIAEKKNVELKGKTLAIIGYGHVGRQVAQLVGILGVKILLNDPPLQEKGEQNLISFEEALTADIICLHTPLIRSGVFPTVHLIGENELKKMLPNAILLNAGRGAVVDNLALYQHLQKNPQFTAILDVWENEPNIHRELAQLCAISTPHIAGYSWDSKINSAKQVVEKMASSLRGAKRRSNPESMTAADFPGLLRYARKDDSYNEFIKQFYDIEQDHQALQALMELPDAQARAQGFDLLRKNYPERREFSASDNYLSEIARSVWLRQ